MTDECSTNPYYDEMPPLAERIKAERIKAYLVSYRAMLHAAGVRETPVLDDDIEQACRG